jgi:hypothetical protein
MEDNDKAMRSPGSRPLLRYTQKEGRNMYQLNIPKFMIWLCLLMCVLTATNLIFACTTNFTCRQFLPTLNYLGCFRGHDRMYIDACTFFAGVLVVFHISAYLRFRQISSGEVSTVLALLGVG